MRLITRRNLQEAFKVPVGLEVKATAAATAATHLTATVTAAVALLAATTTAAAVVVTTVALLASSSGVNKGVNSKSILSQLFVLAS